MKSVLDAMPLCLIDDLLIFLIPDELYGGLEVPPSGGPKTCGDSDQPFCFVSKYINFYNLHNQPTHPLSLNSNNQIDIVIVILAFLNNLTKSVCCLYTAYILDAVTSSRILKAKQKLGVTFNSDKLAGIDFTKFSKLSMCSAGACRCWLVQWPGLPPRHCTWSVLKFL